VKLIRFRVAGAGRQGLLLDDATRLDSAGVADYDEAFFGGERSAAPARVAPGERGALRASPRPRPSVRRAPAQQDRLYRLNFRDTRPRRMEVPEEPGFLQVHQRARRA